MRKYSFTAIVFSSRNNLLKTSIGGSSFNTKRDISISRTKVRRTSDTYNPTPNIRSTRINALPRTEQDNTMSIRTKTKIRDKANAFYHSKRKGEVLVFWTLTFIQDITHDKGVACLNRFLTNLRKSHNFRYIWVAELQTQNNNRLHFHIITDLYWKNNVSTLNQLWLNVQKNKGLTHESKELNPFQSRFIKNANTLAVYLSKYVVKNNIPLQCRCWYCCRGISALCTYFVDDNTIYEQIITERTNCYFSQKTKLVHYGVEKQTDNGSYLPIVNVNIHIRYFKLLIHNVLACRDTYEQNKILYN